MLLNSPPEYSVSAMNRQSVNTQDTPGTQNPLTKKNMPALSQGMSSFSAPSNPSNPMMGQMPMPMQMPMPQQTASLGGTPNPMAPAPNIDAFVRALMGQQ